MSLLNKVERQMPLYVFVFSICQSKQIHNFGMLFLGRALYARPWHNFLFVVLTKQTQQKKKKYFCHSASTDNSTQRKGVYFVNVFWELNDFEREVCEGILLRIERAFHSSTLGYWLMQGPSPLHQGSSAVPFACLPCAAVTH